MEKAEKIVVITDNELAGKVAMFAVFANEGRLPGVLLSGAQHHIGKLMAKYESLQVSDVLNQDVDGLKNARSETQQLARWLGMFANHCDMALIEEKYLQDKELRAYCRKTSELYHAYSKAIFQQRKKLKVKSNTR